MNREQLIRMAMQAGFEISNASGQLPCELAVEDFIGAEELERFASLVAAHEREECARVCDELAELNRTAPQDSMWQWGECAAAIRQRGKARPSPKEQDSAETNAKSGHRRMNDGMASD